MTSKLSFTERLWQSGKTHNMFLAHLIMLACDVFCLLKLIALSIKPILQVVGFGIAMLLVAILLTCGVFGISKLLSVEFETVAIALGIGWVVFWVVWIVFDIMRQSIRGNRSKINSQIRNKLNGEQD